MTVIKNPNVKKWAFVSTLSAFPDLHDTHNTISEWRNSRRSVRRSVDHPQLQKQLGDPAAANHVLSLDTVLDLKPVNLQLSIKVYGRRSEGLHISEQNNIKSTQPW